MFKEIVDAIVTWSPKDIVLAFISACSVIVSLVAVCFYRRALKESQNQNKIANSTAMKESYKRIIECYSNTADPNVVSKMNAFMSINDKQAANSQFRDWVKALSLYQEDSSNLEFFKQYNTLIDIDLLKGIVSNKNLMPYHKVELIAFFNDALKITSININASDIVAQIPSNSDLGTIYLKHNICTKLKNEYKYILGNVVDRQIIKEINEYSEPKRIKEPSSL